MSDSSSKRKQPPSAAGASSDQDPVHSPTTSRNTFFLESPPVTPRSITFNIPPNPFAHPRDDAQQHLGIGTGYPSAQSGSRSGLNSLATSTADLSQYGSQTSGGPVSIRSREAFASPRPRPLTMYSSPHPSSVKVHRERPKSTMITSTSAVEKPWTTAKDPSGRIAYLITYLVMFVGVGLGVLRCYTGWNSVPLLKGNLCPVLDENFDSEDGVFGENGAFFREVDMSGFGNGEFEMTTQSENNSYVRDGYLYITPTLTADVIGEANLLNGYTYNIDGCTYNITQGVSYTTSTSNQGSNSSAIGSDSDFNLQAYMNACSSTSNATTGAIINPVQSARISTRKTASIKYGRVEVRAKIPTGDWLWPAIWMLPVDNTYGPWPISGEIDIMEARGNGPSYPKQGANYVRGSLNWGPLTWLNAVYKTYGWWKLRRGGYDDTFHTYALEWDEEFMRLYVDTRLHHMLELKINEPFFDRGDFPPVVQNGSQAVILENPWVNGTKAAPFDQRFYLIMNVAVGGTNGWFPDGPEKPWLDGSSTPKLDFWRAKNAWLPTWPTDVAKRSMVVDYVKMWQQC